MLVIPAIDLKDGQCVRLKQGRMEDTTSYGNDPVAMAERWVKAGCRRLHLVDLNGAFDGAPVNAQAVKDIAYANPSLPIQIGGGIRSASTIEMYLKAGVQWVILGTKAVEDPDFVRQMCEEFPGNIIVGLDAKDGMVATHGWAEVSNLSAIKLARDFAGVGVSSIVYTDISRDGMLNGVNLESTLELAQEGGLPVIASGGVTDINDIQKLLDLNCPSIIGAITGKAIYEDKLDLTAAQLLADKAAGNV